VSLLAFSLPAALTLLAAVLALIFLLYLLHPRRRRLVVASNLIWRRVAQQRKFRREHWRWLFSLLLASVIGLSMALALTRPEIAALGGVARHVVLVLDNAPSMAARTRDGVSRWEKAIARCRDIIENAGVASDFMLLDTMGRAGIPAFRDRVEALAELDRLKPASFGVARMPILPHTEAGQTQVHLLTDGVAPLSVPSSAHVEPVFETADNVAITAFEARAEPSDPTRYQALVQVFNASAAKKRVTLELTGAPAFALARDVDVPPGRTMDLIFDVSEFSGGELRARALSQGDAFDLDDFAYAVVGSHTPRRVMLVTSGNRYLEDALRLMPGVQLTIETKATHGAAPLPDAYVFDGTAPQEAPERGALVFGAPEAPWLGASFVEVRKPSVTLWADTHPLASDVAWRELRLERAALTPFASGTKQVAIVRATGSGEGALVSAGEAAARWIQVGFALRDSNWHLQAGFPVFLRHALDWLGPQPQTLARGLGYVQIPVANATVTDNAHRPVAATGAASSTLFEAARPGVYAVNGGGGERVLVVNLFDPTVSEINRSRFSRASPPSSTLAQPRAQVEPWVLLLLLVVALLAVEWLTFSRRITV
jgi:Ca-activated chloride channel homolog